MDEISVPEVHTPEPDFPATWPILLGLQCGLCIAGIGVLFHAGTGIAYGLVAAAVIAVPLLLQALLHRVGQRDLMLVAGIVAALGAGLVTIALVLIVAALLVILFFAALFSAGDNWLADGGESGSMVLGFTFLVLAGGCACAALVGSVRATIALRRAGARRQEEGAAA